MIDLYSVASANGQRVHIMLEEAGLAYTPHQVNLAQGAHKKPEFLALNPYARIPVIVDHDGPGQAPVTVAESQLILIYLAEKTGKFLPTDARARLEVLQWLFYVGANIVPAFRGLFFFLNRAPEKNPMSIARYVEESRQGFALLDEHLKNRDYVAAGQYTVADMSAYPVAVTSAKLLDDGLLAYPNLQRWVNAIGKREAVAKGMKLFA